MQQRPPPGNRLGLAIALGLVTTVAIAWAAMFIPWGHHGYGPPLTTDLGLARDETAQYPRIWQISEGRNAWHHVVTCWWMQVSGQSMWIPEDDFQARRLDLDSLPQHLRPESLDSLIMLSSYREVGWPMKALTCSIHWKQQILNEDVVYAVQGGIQLPRDREYIPRALPLVPVWPGFAANVLIWSSAWLALLHLAAAARARWRERRSRCWRCGYPRTGLAAGSACPECGQTPPGRLNPPAAQPIIGGPS